MLIFVIHIRSSLERHENPACCTLLGVLDQEIVLLQKIIGEFGHLGARSLENINRLGVLCQLQGCVARLIFGGNFGACV